MHDAVGVDVEGDLDLRHAARGRRETGELEGAQALVVGRHLALALVDLDEHARLVVVRRREDLAALGRDRRIALDETGHHAALGLDAEGERGDVEEQHVLDLALEHAGLQCSTDRDDLIGVDALVGVLARDLLDDLSHRGHAGRAADEHHLVDVLDLDAGVLDDRLDRGLGAVQQVGRHLLELSARERLLQVEGALGARGDVGQVDRGLHGARQLDLRLLRGLAQALHGHLVLGQVHAVGVLEVGHEPVDDLVVPVVATEVVVTAGGLDLDHAVADLQEGHVEGAATKVEDEDRLLLVALVEAVGQGGRGGLVDDAQDVEACDLAGLLGGLALRVVEVRRHGDDRVGDGVTEVGLGVALELHEHARADLLRGVRLAVDVGGPVGAHVALDRTDRAIDVGHRLALGHLSDEDFAVLGEGDDRGGRASALGVGDDDGVSALKDGHDGVGRAQVDADCSGHQVFPLSVCFRLLAWPVTSWSVPSNPGPLGLHRPGRVRIRADL